MGLSIFTSVIWRLLGDESEGMEGRDGKLFLGIFSSILNVFFVLLCYLYL